MGGVKAILLTTQEHLIGFFVNYMSQYSLLPDIALTSVSRISRDGLLDDGTKFARVGT
jgi:hypothetical protein